MRPDSSNDERCLKAAVTLHEVLVEIGWEPAPVEGTHGYSVDFGAPHLPVSHALAAILEAEQFVFYINFGVEVAADRRDETARFVTRANWGLNVGNFELDYETGIVRFKTSIAFEGAELSRALIRSAIRASMEVVEAYSDALLAVVVRGQSAEAGIREVESTDT